jgi:hypothetical protein
VKDGDRTDGRFDVYSASSVVTQDAAVFQASEHVFDARAPPSM